MPFLLPAIAAVGSAIAGVGAAVGAAAAGLAGTLGVGVLGQLAIEAAVTSALPAVLEFGALAGASALLTPKPKVNTAGSPQTFKADPDAPIPIVMGRYGVGGNLVYETTSGGSNKAEHGAQGNEYLTHFTILSGLGPIEQVEYLRFDDTILTFSGETCSGGYIPQVEVQAYNPGYVQIGSGAYAGSYQNSVFANHAWQSLSYGGAPNPTFGYPQKLHQDNGALPEWDGKGFSLHASSALTIVYDQTVYTGGVPQRQWVLKGHHVYDPRLDATYPGGSGNQRWAGVGASSAAIYGARNSWTWSQNPALHALNYALGYFVPDGVTGLGRHYLGIGAGPAGVDIAAFVHAANVADANGWKICGQWTSQDGKWSVLTAMLQACGAVPHYDRGRISCLVSEPRTSIGTVTAADLAGDISLGTSVSRRERPNTIFYKYSSEAHRWQVVQADTPISPATYVAEDGGVRVGNPLTLEYVPSVDQAAQLTAYAIADGRELPGIQLIGKPHLRGFAVGDCLTVDIPEAGLATTKVVVTKRTTSISTGQVTLLCRTETDAKHPYALGRSGVAPPTPGISGIDPSIVPAPIPAAWTAVPTTLPDASGAITHIIRINGSTIDNVFATDVIVDFASITAVGGVDVLGPLQHKTYAASVQQIDLSFPPGRYHVWLRYRTGTGAENVENSLDLGVFTVVADTAATAGGLINDDGSSTSAAAILASVDDAIAQGQAALANANAARTTALTAVTYNPSIINPNPDFFAYSSPTGPPDGYTTTGTGASFSRADGVNGKPYAAEINTPAAPTDVVRLLTSSSLRMVRGWVVVETEFRITNGSLDWRGMGARWRNTDATYHYDIDFATDPDTNGVVRTAADYQGWSYKFSKLFQVTVEDYGAALIFFGATDAFAPLAGQPSRQIHVDHLAVRPASQAEIDGHQALPAARSYTDASVAAEASARAGADGALASSVSTVTARVAAGGRNLVVNPSFALGAQGWTLSAGTVGGAGDVNGPYVVAAPPDNTTAYYRLAEQMVTVNGSQRYSVQASIYAGGLIDNGNAFARAAVVWFAADGSSISEIDLSTNRRLSWTTFRLDGISTPGLLAPANAVRAGLYLDVASSNGQNLRTSGDNVAFTTVKFERSDYASSFSDEALSAAVTQTATAVALINGTQAAEWKVGVVAGAAAGEVAIGAIEKRDVNGNVTLSSAFRVKAETAEFEGADGSKLTFAAQGGGRLSVNNLYVGFAHIGDLQVGRGKVIDFSTQDFVNGDNGSQTFYAAKQTWVGVVQVAKTIAGPNSVVRVEFDCDASYTVFAPDGTPGPGYACQYRLLVDGADQGGHVFVGNATDYQSGYFSGWVPVNSAPLRWAVSGLSAGTHVFRLEFYTGTLESSASGGGGYVGWDVSKEFIQEFAK